MNHILTDSYPSFRVGEGASAAARLWTRGGGGDGGGRRRGRRARGGQRGAERSRPPAGLWSDHHHQPPGFSQRAGRRQEVLQSHPSPMCFHFLTCSPALILHPPLLRHYCASGFLLGILLCSSLGFVCPFVSTPGYLASL